MQQSIIYQVCSATKIACPVKTWSPDNPITAGWAGTEHHVKMQNYVNYLDKIPWQQLVIFV